MPTRKAHAVWNGTLKEGNGQMDVESGAFKGAYSFSTRFEDQPGTNPEELIGAAHAGCFSMAFSLLLEEAGYKAESIETDAQVRIDPVEGGFKITQVHLNTRGKVPGCDAGTFQEVAEKAKGGCPVSQALAGTEISMEAELLS